MARRWLVRLLALTAFGVAGCSSTPSAQVPTTPHPSTSRSEEPADSLAARWWLWAGSTPTETNPVTDTTGRQCSGMQPTDVWFLAGTFGDGPVTRKCKIPSGRQVFLPVLNQVCPLNAAETSADALARCSASADEVVATLDDVPLGTQEQTSGGTFTMTSVAGSPVFEAGEAESVAWGIWIGPVTIPDGTHVLHVLGRSGTFTVDVTYNLNVG
jgi:hypothetical protein